MLKPDENLRGVWLRDGSGTSREESWADFLREGVPPEGCSGEDLLRGKALRLRLKMFQGRWTVWQGRLRGGQHVRR